MAAAALRWLRYAIQSCSSRVMPFSRAIFSADWPMVRPVDGSAMAGAWGARSAGRSLAKAFSFAARLRALEASTRVWAIRRLCRMGMSDRLSAPPAIPTEAWPSRISSTTSAIASPADAQARLTVWAGMLTGRPVPRTTSRARLGAATDGMTWPMTTVSTAAGSASLRSTSSRTHARARSTAVRSR